MESVIFVEVLDRRGRVQRRDRIDSFPFSVGRAYSNDVIVDDRLVDPEHLIVRQTEAGLRLEDQESRNGVFGESPRRRVESLKLRPGSEVRIGHTRLRFCTPDQSVGPAAQQAGSGIATLFASTWAKVLAIVLGALTLPAAEYFERYGKIEFSQLASSLAVAFSLLLLWTGLWALGNRLVSHEFRFLGHWTVVSVATIFFALATTGFEYLNFFFSTSTVFEVMEWSASALISVALLYAHLSVASTMGPARRGIAAAMAVAVLYGLFGVMEFAGRDHFSSSPELSSELKPVGAGWLRARAPTEFFDRVGALEEELERLAKKEAQEEAQ